MKQLIKKTKGIVKGVPSAVLLSALIHLLILFIAGGLVIFTVVKKQEKKFVPPPPVKRPVMDIKKPRPKVKTSAPPAAARHIVSKNVNIMAEIQLPDITGISSTGMGTGLSGIELVPDLSEMSVFGSKKSISVGNDFVGTYYSFYYDRVGNKVALDEKEVLQLVQKFQKLDWNPMVFAPYFQGPQKLYTTQIFFPTMPTEFAPFLFGIPHDVNYRTQTFCIYYKGKIARKEGGRYRFWGASDMLLVRVNGKLVLNAGYERRHDEYAPDWDPESPELGEKYTISGGNFLYAGDWFELEPGEPVDMEVLIGDPAAPGGGFAAMLLVEDANGIYSENRQGMKILPVFKTAEIPDVIKDEIKYIMIPTDADLDSELMFNVY